MSRAGFHARPLVRASLRKREMEELQSLLREREAELETLKRERERLIERVEMPKKQLAALKGEESKLPGLVRISLPEGAAEVIWNLLRAEEVVELASGPEVILRLKVGGEGIYVQRAGGVLSVITEGTLAEAFRERPVTLRLRAPPAFDPPPRGLRKALVKNLAQFWATLDQRHKITLFVMNLLPLLRAVGIDVGDETYTRPFKVLRGRGWSDREVRFPIYTPEQAVQYLGGVDVEGAHFRGETFVGVMVEFWEHALRQLAARYPDILGEASGLVALRGGGLPRSEIEKALKGVKGGSGEGGEEG